MMATQSKTSTLSTSLDDAFPSCPPPRKEFTDCNQRRGTGRVQRALALAALTGGDVLLRGPEVAAVVGVSLATLYRMIEAGQFPRPISPSPGVRAWPMSVVQAFIKQLAGEGATDAR